MMPGCFLLHAALAVIMVRTNWLNWNGVWQFQPNAKNDSLPSGNLFGDILVPFLMSMSAEDSASERLFLQT